MNENKTISDKVPDLGYHFTTEELRRIARARDDAQQYMNHFGRGAAPKLIIDYNLYENSLPPLN